MMTESMKSETKNDSRNEFPPKSILVPLDFSGQSQKALTYAECLAETFGAMIHLAHIVEPTAVVVGFEVGSAPVNEMELQGAEQRLSEIVRELPKHSVGRTIVRHGWAVDEVIALVQELRIDLIILSAHGRSGIQRVLFGSTADGISRRAACPVLVLRRNERDFIDTSRTQEQRFALALKEILVPVDFSGASRRALHYAIQLAQRTRAKLVCLHISPPIPETLPDIVAVGGLESVRNHVCETTEKSLASFLKEESAFIPRDNVLKAGSVPRDVIDTADERKLDLIVMGAQGKNGGGRFLLGSTSERVVRHASCPVVVVREPQRSE